MSNPNERFSVRIKQQATGAWRGVSYHRSLQAAIRAARRAPTRDYIWAVFDGSRKVADWTGKGC